MPTFRLNPLSRSTRTWVASLGLAALLPLGVQAHSAHSPNGSLPSQVLDTQTGRFIELSSLLPARSLSADVPSGTEQLRSATGLNLSGLALDSAERFGDLKVYTGGAFSGVGARALQAVDDVIVVARRDGSFIALLPESNIVIRGEASGQQTLTRYDASHTHPPASRDYVEDPQADLPHEVQSFSGARSFLVDRNAEGEVVVDVLAGFSRNAVEYIGDHEAYALAQIASVNLALKNSRVEGVRLRLVGTQVIDSEHAITRETLHKLNVLFADGMRQYGPDLVTGFFRGITGEDTMLGWGNIRGRYSINVITSPTTFRHEVGHNIGANHCPEGDGYRYGYHNGRVGTIMCGNQVNYFSNPDLRDRQGVPLGHPEMADVARLWRENSARMSAYSPSVVPLETERATRFLEERVTLDRNEWRYFPIDVLAGTERLAFTANHGAGHEIHGRIQLYLRYGKQPTATQFDERSIMAAGVALGVKDPRPGRWYLAMRVQDNRTATDQVLEGHAFARQQDTVEARYLRLVAKSAIEGGNAASISELHLAGADGRSLPRDQWRVISSKGYKPENAIDGGTGTYWYSSSKERYPYDFVIDLGARERFSQLHYLPRQSSGLFGNIKDYEVHASDRPDGDWTLLAEGQFSADNLVKLASLKPVGAILPPVAQIAGPASASAGDTVRLDASASSDPQGSVLSYTWSASPRLDFSYDGPRVSFKAPALDRDTRYTFELAVSNGKHTVRKTHPVLVKAGIAGSPACHPAWSATSDYVSGSKVQRKGRTYEARWWTRGNEPGDPAFTGLDGSGKVWRDLGACGGASTETPENPPVVLPPVAHISGPSTAIAGGEVRLSAAASTDPGGLPLTYRWGASPQVPFKASGANLTFVAPPQEREVAYRFTLTLSNGQKEATRTHEVKVGAQVPEQPGTGGCAKPWSADEAYWEGGQATHKGRLYTARWWNRGSEPGKPEFTGADGSGKVWRDEGTCN
ncbi:discoidin domain-containing protein [Pseudomonas tohonis]|uniref:discoidin domain-containing protein n=1 Tax=Pseudomonas tohonis TaxID=2725477 RepID=UPI001F3E2B17|nr:discoidin domain-containing protein [Pseudomonas tohonis]